MGVLGVLVTDERVREVTNHNGVSSAVQDILSLRIPTQVDWVTSRGGRKRGIKVLFVRD